MARQQRARYSNYVKDQVRQRYPLCRTTAHKEQLAQELGIGSVAKLYNLASRLGATGKEGAERHSYAVAREEERLLVREDPATTVFSSEADQYLRAEFGRRAAFVIAFHLHHTETAILYRARHLGLRRPVKYWDIFPWLVRPRPPRFSEAGTLKDLTFTRSMIPLLGVSSKRSSQQHLLHAGWRSLKTVSS